MIKKKMKKLWHRQKTEQRVKVNILLGFSIAYILFFGMLAIAQKNFEFIYYIGVAVLLIIATSSYYKEFYLSYHVIAGLSILGLLHVMGGMVYIWNTRLYDLYLIGTIFKYDNLVHMFGSVMVTIVAYNMLRPHINKHIRHNPIFYGILLLLVVSGVGALNEIIEFFAVVVFESQGVGGYTNNALDLVFNLIGAALAAMYIFALNKQSRKKPDIVLKTRRQP